MLDNVDLSLSMGKKEYKKEIAGLKQRLTVLQQTIKEFKIPVLMVFEGWSAAGKGTLISKVLYPLDPRYFNVITMDKPNEETLMRPFLWKFAINAPSAGRITIFDKSWHRLALPEGVEQRKMTEVEKESFYYDVNAFEHQLTESGALIIKLFLHISKDEQKKRFEELEKRKDTKWRVNTHDWKQNKDYDKYSKLFSHMLEQSNFGLSKWAVIEANDKYYATIKIYKIIINKIEDEIKKRASLSGKTRSGAATSTEKSVIEAASSGNIANESMENENRESGRISVLSAINPSMDISDNEYKEKLAFYQNKIAYLGFKLYAKRKSVIIVYEGWDAAGKGGNIKRLTQELDPRGYEVVPVAAPTVEELNHHYLWRFWKHVPKDGHIAIFDRSWYGRVMVERIEGFCTEEEWRRAYKEMNDMEQHFYNHGAMIFKFWLHIDKEEQLQRFKSRQTDPLKQYKITDEDWRNREKWNLYEEAVDEMIIKTNTGFAPWVVVESNNKKYARIKTLEHVTEVMEKRLK